MEYVKAGSIGFETKIPQLKACEYPRQIRWINFDSETGDVLYGIQLGDKVICACCGGIFPIDELNELAYNALCTSWVEIGEEWVSFADEMAYDW